MKKRYRVTAGALGALLVCGMVSPTFAAASVSKDDTVYATLDPSGAVAHQTVSSWLHSDKGLTNFADVSDLQDIVNLKSDELPKQDGTALIWNVDGNDVYYQGASTDTLPIETEITYMLDGNPVEASALAGASGHLAIHIAFHNNAVETRTIDGVEYEICVPYFVLVGTDLSTDHFVNIEAEDGIIETDSTNQIVGFLTMPGMRDTYGDLLDGKLSEVRDKLLDSVDIECDMKDGELPSLYVAYASDLSALDELDGGEFGDVDEMFDQLDELKDATQQLIDGSRELADGCSTLDDKLGELSSNYVVFHDGIIDACSGAGLLTDATKQLCSGMRTLTLGADTLGDGVDELADGAKTLEEGAKQTDAGASALSTGLNTLDSNSSDLSEGSRQLAQGLDQLSGALTSSDVQALFSGSEEMKRSLSDLSDGMQKVCAAVEGSDFSTAISTLDKMETLAYSLAENAEDLGNDDSDSIGEARELTEEQEDALKEMDGGDEILEKFEDNVATIEDASESSESGEDISDQLKILAETLGKVSDGLRKSNDEMKELKESLATINSGLATASSKYSYMNSGLQELAGTLGSSVTKLHEGAVSLDSGIAKYTSGVSSAAQGAAQLAAGTKQVSGGASQLASGIDTLNSKVPELKNGMNQLSDGADQLDSGAGELSAGMQQLQSASATVQNAIYQFDEAGTQLSDGAGTLYDGIVQYNEEGISKITENQTLTDLRTASKIFEEQRDMADAQSCYSGAPASAAETTTKFVMRTQEVAPEEVETEQPEETKKETLWDRIKGLF